MSSVPAFTTLMDTKPMKTQQKVKRGGAYSDSSPSPVGEKGDDGEGGVMRVREDVLDEQVGLAAVLWAEFRINT